MLRFVPFLPTIANPERRVQKIATAAAKTRSFA
jgi:hypothetical protein